MIKIGQVRIDPRDGERVLVEKFVEHDNYFILRVVSRGDGSTTTSGKGNDLGYEYIGTGFYAMSNWPKIEESFKISQILSKYGVQD